MNQKTNRTTKKTKRKASNKTKEEHKLLKNSIQEIEKGKVIHYSTQARNVKSNTKCIKR